MFEYLAKDMSILLSCMVVSKNLPRTCRPIAGCPNMASTAKPYDALSTPLTSLTSISSVQPKSTGDDSSPPLDNAAVSSHHQQQSSHQPSQQSSPQQPQQPSHQLQHHAYVAAQAAPPSQPTGPSNTAVSAPAISAPLASNSYDRADCIPGVKSMFIYPHAEVTLGKWKANEYDARFRFVSEEMRKTVNENPDLRDRADTIDYRLHMGGPSPEEATPHIVIFCRREDFRKLSDLFKKRVKDPLYCGKKSKVFHLFREDDPDKMPVPPFQLLYYRSPKNPKKRTAGDENIHPELGRHITWCGAVAHHGSRTATLGLTIRVGDSIAVMTVDHLFEPEKQEHADSLITTDTASLDMDASSESTLNDDEMEDLGELWTDKVMEYDEDYEDEISEEWDGEPRFHSSVQGDSFFVDRIRPPRQLDGWEAYLDWSLVTPSAQQPLFPLPNQYFPSGPEGQAIALEKFAKAPRFHRVPVHVVSGIRGVLPGRLLGSTAMLGSGPDRVLCEAWTVILDTTQSIIDGESGSLVIDQETHEIYGHVVACDPRGYAYVVPMTKIWTQMETQFGPGSIHVFTPETAPNAMLGQSHKSIDQPRSLGWTPDATKTETADDGPGTIPATLDNHDPAFDTDAAVVSVSVPSPLGQYEIPDIRLPELVSDAILSGERISAGDDSSDEEASAMQDALVSAMVPTHWGTRQFLPRTALSTIVNTNNVCQELERLVRNRDLPKRWLEVSVRETADVICQASRSFQKVFAILVLLDRAGYIFDMIAAGTSDDCLPLVHGSEEELQSATQPHLKLTYTRRWRPFAKHGFEDRQWSFLAPVFSKGDDQNPARHYNFSDRQILPFIGGPGRETAELVGGFASVTSVVIHPDHHEFTSMIPLGYQGNRFALKELKALSSDDDFKSEMKALQFATKQSNRHLLSLLATYQYHGRYHFILPWADMNLEQYCLSADPTSQRAAQHHQWVIEQCRGLAEALSILHRERVDPEGLNDDRAFYRHGDIKPSNILIFGTGTEDAIGGSLVLADFGLARNHNRRTQSRQMSDRVFGTVTYEAPETAQRLGARSRAVDIWSLGCVYLEFLTWLLLGPNGFDEFGDKRLAMDGLYGFETDTFYALYREDNMLTTTVKPAVVEMFHELHASPQASELIHDLLDIIQLDMLEIEPTKRIKSLKLAEKLQILEDKSRFNEDYLLRPCTRGRGVPEPGVQYSVSKVLSKDAAMVRRSRRPGQADRTIRIYSERRSRVKIY